MRILVSLVMLLGLSGPALALDRIGVRVVDGEGEFFNTVSGERFRPRGVNYLDFKRVGGGRQDRVLDAEQFDPEKIARAFEVLRAHGYDTVRVFFDHCMQDATCIVRRGERGLSPVYMDNMAAFTRLAAEHGIYVLFTSNDIPDHGGYGELANRDAGPLVEGYRNAHFTTAGGVEAFESYWGDLMAALGARDTAWEAVLGWSILNEQWLFKKQPPWSLDEGTVSNGTGKTYDLSDPAQKRALVADNLVLISQKVRDAVKSTDPEALVTMGFFAPKGPNETFIGGDWFVDTEPLLARAPLDFYDFHAYTDTDLNVRQQAENFGMPQHRDKAVIMGEVGSSSAFIPRIEEALRAEQEWMAESCDEGFDGWLHWGFYEFPAGVDQHPPYTFLYDGDELFLTELSPNERPDPCLKGGYEPHINLAYEATATASRSLPDHGPQNALDGRETTWESGRDAPGWIDIQLAAPSRLGEVTLWLAQWPAGETRHRVTARLDDGTDLLVADRVTETADDQKLTFVLPGGVPGVTGLRVEILHSPSWVSFRDVQLLRDTSEAPVCLLQARSAVNLRGDPSTANPPVGRLPAGISVLATGREAGADGHDWFETSLGGYVRGDVVAASEGCD